MLTKKYYSKIAGILATIEDISLIPTSASMKLKKVLVAKFAALLLEDNMNFNLNKFMDVCYKTDKYRGVK